MGKKSREKGERRQVRSPVRPIREGRVTPGIRVNRQGEQVVLTKKMTGVQHEEFLRGMRARAVAVPAELVALRDRLLKVIAEVNTAEFLVRMADRFLPHDPETYRESQGHGIAIQVEYPTWLALQLPEPRMEPGPMEYRTFAEAEEVLEAMAELTTLGMTLDPLARGVTNPTDEDEIIAMSRNWELVVRNPGFIVHLEALLEALFTDAGDLERLAGFSIADLLSVLRVVALHGWDRFSDAMSSTLDSLRPRVRDIWRGKHDSELKEMIPLEYRRKMTTATMRQAGALPLIHGERGKVLAQAADLCTVTPAWLAAETGVSQEKCRKILDRFTLNFGQTPVADNLMSRYEPLETRPLVAFPGERYLPHLLHLWHWGARPSLEELLATEKAAWDRYENRRAHYVEDRALALFSKMLPGADVEARLTYKMPDETGTVRRYELDGLVAYGPVLFLLEGKGGKISHAALRGAPSRLKEELRKLVGIAHRQALRTRRYVASYPSVKFTRGDGTVFELAGADHPEVYLVSITLAALDVFLMRLGHLQEMGILGEGDFPWAVSLLDLEVIADHIEWGPQLIHYLRRRLPLNRKDVVATEELDFFASYLVDGLAVADAANGSTHVLVGTTNTAGMDNYYHYRQGTRETPTDIMRMRLPEKTRAEIQSAATLAPADALVAVTSLLDQALKVRRSR